MPNNIVLAEPIQVKLFAYKLPFRNPMQFKQYQLHQREGLILQIIDKNGVNRFAEIAPLPGFSKETFAQVKQEMIQLISGSGSILNKLTKHMSAYPSIQFALDSILLAINTTQEITIDNVALLQGNRATIISQYKQLDHPELIKLKVAKESIDIDIDNFQQLCQLNPKLKIRCDANQAWNEKQAEQFFTAINIKQLDYIEEPTCDHQKNLKLAEKFSIKLGLDETLQQSNFNYQAHQSIRAFIIKPALIGSKHKIDKLVSIAKSSAIKISISSSFESIVGLQQLKHLATSYLHHSQQKTLALSLGIDTLKYFSSTQLQDKNKIEDECQQLELLCSSNK